MENWISPSNLGTLYCGDSLTILNNIDTEVDMVITSPPYWGQRDYGIEGQIGLEDDFKSYLNLLVNIINTVKLKDTGSIWINIGDTYYYNSRGTGGKSKKQDGNVGSWFSIPKRTKTFLPEGTLMNIPNRLAVQLADCGWLLRNTIIWHKPNQFPTSAKRRFTQDFEYLYWFVKDIDKYYFEQQFEPYLEKINRWGGVNLKADGNSDWDAGTGQNAYRDRSLRPNSLGRNKRTVWNIPTSSVKGLKHYATYPKELIKTPILATCPEDGIVLDPFMGSGTTALVCEELKRHWIGIELNPEYCETIKNRVING